MQAERNTNKQTEQQKNSQTTHKKANRKLGKKGDTRHRIKNTFDIGIRHDTRKTFFNII